MESVRKDVECTFGILKKRWRILKNHILLQSKGCKASIDNVVFTCAILHNMLLDNEEWNDEDDNYDIGADVGANVMDPRVVNLRHGPADCSYVGGGNLMMDDVQVESEWMTLRSNLVRHYMYCFGRNLVKW